MHLGSYFVPVVVLPAHLASLRIILSLGCNVSSQRVPGCNCIADFDVIMVLHIISYKVITTVGIYTNFSRLFETFGTMFEIMFSSDSMSKKNFNS